MVISIVLIAIRKFRGPYITLDVMNVGRNTKEKNKGKKTVDKEEK